MKKSLLLCTTLVPLILYQFASCDNSKILQKLIVFLKKIPQLLHGARINLQIKLQVIKRMFRFIE